MTVLNYAFFKYDDRIPEVRCLEHGTTKKEWLLGWATGGFFLLSRNIEGSDLSETEMDLKIAELYWETRTQNRDGLPMVNDVKSEGKTFMVVSPEAVRDDDFIHGEFILAAEGATPDELQKAAEVFFCLEPTS